MRGPGDRPSRLLSPFVARLPGRAGAAGPPGPPGLAGGREEQPPTHPPPPQEAERCTWRRVLGAQP